MFEKLPDWVPAALRVLLANGGVVVALLLLMALVALSIVLIKLWQLRCYGVLNGRAQRRVGLLLDGETSQAIPADVAAMPAVGIAISVLELIRGNRLSAEGLAKEASRQLEQYQRQLTQYLSSLDLIATLAPSLGLFGTVLGMIEAFQAMELAGRNVEPSVLSGGVWQALLTTAVGLGVAIPTIIAANALGRRVESHLAQLDDRIARLLTFTGH